MFVVSSVNSMLIYRCLQRCQQWCDGDANNGVCI